MIKAAQGLLPSLAFTDSISVGSCLLPLLRCQDYSSSKGFRPIFTTINTTKMSTESYQFGPYKIDPKEVFYSTYLSYAMVNLRPLLPGIISPIEQGRLKAIKDPDSPNNIIGKGFTNKQIDIHQMCTTVREVKRFVDLTADETSDLWFTAKKVGSQLERFHSATSLTFAIQDGPQAGQTVPHVHIHIIPRKGGDFEKNDEIYDAIDEKEKELKQKLDLDKERSDRSMEEMAQEADEYRLLFL